MAIPNSVNNAKDDPNWKRAMDDEMRAVVDNRTWELVPREAHQNVLSCKWIFKLKKNELGEIIRHKERLVVTSLRQKQY